MSEKTLWKMLQRAPSVHGFRLEKCCIQGIPDCLIRVDNQNLLVELKDWSKKPYHPLSIAQLNFISEYDGRVLIDFGNDLVGVLKPPGLLPLTKGDKSWAVKHANVCLKKDFTGRKLL